MVLRDPDRGGVEVGPIGTVEALADGTSVVVTVVLDGLRLASIVTRSPSTILAERRGLPGRSTRPATPRLDGVPRRGWASLELREPGPHTRYDYVI